MHVAIEGGMANPRARALSPLEDSFTGKYIECLAHRRPGNTKQLTQFALRWHKATHRVFLRGNIVAQAFEYAFMQGHRERSHASRTRWCGCTLQAVSLELPARQVLLRDAIPELALSSSNFHSPGADRKIPAPLGLIRVWMVWQCAQVSVCHSLP